MIKAGGEFGVWTPVEFLGLPHSQTPERQHAGLKAAATRELRKKEGESFASPFRLF
jgi:hypothetical protein